MELKVAFESIQSNWTEELLYKFKNVNEDVSNVDLFYDELNNNRFNWLDNNKDLLFYFNKNGISDKCDLSRIVLTSFHRYLNKKPIEIDSLFAEYTTYRRHESKCKKNAREKAFYFYNNFNVGDKIIYKSLIEKTADNYIIVSLECPNNQWVFNKNVDLLIEGELIFKEKFFNNESSYFKIRIDSINIETYSYADLIKKRIEKNDTILINIVNNVFEKMK
jgi:hypothetical protein